MNPIDNEDAYHALVIGGVVSPGVVTLSGFKREVKWDVKAGGGEDGASTSRNGKDPAKGTATFSLVLDPVLGVDEFAAWEAFLPTLQSTFDKAAPQALDVYHPDLALLGITAVVVEGIGQLTHDGMGGASVVVDLLEYRPPKKKAVGKSKGSKAKKQGWNPAGYEEPPEADPNQAANDELDKQRALWEAP